MSEEQKKPRANLLLPTTLERHRRIDQLENLIHWLWHELPPQEESISFDLLRAYISLITDSAMPADVARITLRSLGQKEMSRCSALEIPAQRGDRSKRKTRLGVGKRTRLAIYCAMSPRSPSAIQTKNALARSDPSFDLDARLGKQLKFALEASGNRWRISMSDIAELAPFIAIRNGVEPFHFTVLSGRIRPVSQDVDDPYRIDGVAQETLSHLFHGADGLALSLRSMQTDDLVDCEADLSPPPDWIGESKIILRAMCQSLSQEIGGRCDTPHKKEVARRIFDDARDTIPASYPKSCVTRIAIDFAEKRFVVDASVIARSIHTYLSRCVLSGLLSCDAAYDLDDWDPDDFFENAEERIANKRLSRETKGLILHAYNQFLKFACPKLRIPAVSLNTLRQQFVGGAGQWRLISPHATDRLLTQLAESGSQLNRQIAVTIALAYCGGLRASEVRRLTLANIVFDDALGLFEIELLRGKSRNSRRRLPLQCLAGSLALNLIREEWESRKTQFALSTGLSKIAFLGIPGNRNGYSYNSLSAATRVVLKAAFGETANIHLLRHSFCSNLFVRWYALRYPNILDHHRDRSHDIYQPALQSKLSDFFTNLPGQEGDARPSDLIVMIKVTGHATPRTLFIYYIHSYTLVHAHTVERLAQSYLDEKFSDGEIRSLVPGMRSSASRARLNDRTIGGICNHLGLT